MRLLKRIYEKIIKPKKWIEIPLPKSSFNKEKIKKDIDKENKKQEEE